MKSVPTRAILGGFVVIASLAISGSASAQSKIWARWKNAASPASTPYYMGVSGGKVCSWYGCGVATGTQIIMWTKSDWDQEMGAPDPANGGGPGLVQDDYNDYEDGETPMCLALQNNATSGGQNTNFVIWDCGPQNPGQNIQLKRAEDLSPAAPYPGCYAFIDQGTGMALSVYQGNLYKGARVVNWPLCVPNSGACGSPSNAYHADQFWCPDYS